MINLRSRTGCYHSPLFTSTFYLKNIELLTSMCGTCMSHTHMCSTCRSLPMTRINSTWSHRRDRLLSIRNTWPSWVPNISNLQINVRMWYRMLEIVLCVRIGTQFTCSPPDTNNTNEKTYYNANLYFQTFWKYYRLLFIESLLHLMAGLGHVGTSRIVSVKYMLNGGGNGGVSCTHVFITNICSHYLVHILWRMYCSSSSVMTVHF